MVNSRSAGSGRVSCRLSIKKAATKINAITTQSFIMYAVGLSSIRVREAHGELIRNFRAACVKAFSAASPVCLVHDFRPGAAMSFERGGDHDQLPMRRLNHRTKSIRRRYASTDSTMLQEAVVELANLHAADLNDKNMARTGAALTRLNRLLQKPAEFLYSSFCKREWRNGRRAGLRIRCRKAWGFKSPLSQSII
jgi:hypothetical protein